MCDAGTEPLMARRRQAEEPGCGRTAGPALCGRGFVTVPTARGSSALWTREATFKSAPTSHGDRNRHISPPPRSLSRIQHSIT